MDEAAGRERGAAGPCGASVAQVFASFFTTTLKVFSSASVK